jgi:hypothetical protein
MDVTVIQQMFREFVFMSFTVVCAVFLVGGFIFLEERLKRDIIQSAKAIKES